MCSHYPTECFSEQIIAKLKFKDENERHSLVLVIFFSFRVAQNVDDSSPELSTKFPISAILYTNGFVWALLLLFLLEVVSKVRSKVQLSEDIAQELLSTEAKAVLKNKLTSHFNYSELQELCFELGINFKEEIPGNDKKQKVMELIGYCERRGRLQELIERAKRYRPHIPWP